jgi:hypothetical protein
MNDLDKDVSIQSRPDVRTWGEAFSRRISRRGLIGSWLMFLAPSAIFVTAVVADRGPVAAALGVSAWLALSAAVLFKATKNYMAGRAQRAAENRFRDPHE